MSLSAFLSGATAGLCVDLTLFPLDTIKTRLQSAQHGVRRSSGSLRLFAGLPAVIVGSAPGAATFFLTYETVKNTTHTLGLKPVVSSVVAACIAEIAACVVRVPCEVVKQRAQNAPHYSISSIFMNTIRAEGVRGFYRGYASTILREIPFSLIQFPIWERLKFYAAQWNHGQAFSSPPSPTSFGFADPHELKAWQSALCGSLAGGLAGALTTPLDVAKTRIMLAKPNTPFASGNILTALQLIFRESGFLGLFAGLTPRVTFLSLGGAIFLGIYDISSRFWCGWT
ncbi:unnamed protein product [Calicophoron daubneyi]|uniref:Uncharacterized protein n=1 Tax=Calicophoron daubneyi TaxID=300641 RepID=A0AAV2TEL0_CALDB